MTLLGTRQDSSNIRSQVITTGIMKYMGLRGTAMLKKQRQEPESLATPSPPFLKSQLGTSFLGKVSPVTRKPSFSCPTIWHYLGAYKTLGPEPAQTCSEMLVSPGDRFRSIP